LRDITLIRLPPPPATSSERLLAWPPPGPPLTPKGAAASWRNWPRSSTFVLPSVPSIPRPPPETCPSPPAMSSTPEIACISVWKLPVKAPLGEGPKEMSWTSSRSISCSTSDGIRARMAQ
jgi:hypothetical protein